MSIFSIRGLVAAAVVAVTTVPALAKDPILVTMDRAKVMRISAPAKTVIIGNPGIADASIQDRQTLVITGRMVGITNLVILDAKGEPIADEVLQVEPVQDSLVSVQRGGSRFSYSCTPVCSGTLMTGDDQEHFNKSMSQITGVNQRAMTYSGTQ